MNRARFEALPADLQAVVNNACAAESAYSLAEADWRNAAALDTLVRQRGVQVRAFPPELVRAARKTAAEVLAEFAQGDELSRRIYRSYAAARQQTGGWSRIGTQAALAAREEG